MFFRNLFLLILLFSSGLCLASDGVIRFTGQLTESTCNIQIDKTDKTETSPLAICSKHVAASTAVQTQVVAPNPHMLTWRANDTLKPDAPVTHWKVTEVTYL